MPKDTKIPAKTSDLENDSGFLTEETDPSVPEWAKQSKKPSYTADEVGALPKDTKIPAKTSDLENDSGFIDKTALEGKLDKNLGVENANMILGTDESGNVIAKTGTIGTSASDNTLHATVEKQENPSIDDGFEREMKHLMFHGKSTQVQENDIVPTPARAVPINSRKVLANGEYVELRSLKETSNLFDYRLYILLNSEYFSLSDDGNGIKILKPDDRDISEIAYELDFDINTYLSFMWDGDNGQGIELQVWIKYESGDWQEYSTVSDGLSKATLGVGNNEKIKMRFKFVGVAGAEKINIGLYDYSQNVTSYIAPTIRDYKIINHVDKTAKIIRNVHEVNLNNLNFVYNDTKTDYSRFYTSVNPALKYVGKIYSNVFTSYGAYDYTKEAIYGGNSYGGKVISITVKDSNITEHTQEALLAYINNPNAVAYYALETLTEETIIYSTDDTTEIGLSWQDTTSPSPTIKSEVTKIDKIDCTVCKKNLFDLEKAKNKENWIPAIEQVGYSDFIIKVIKGKQYTFSYDGMLNVGLAFYAGIVINQKDITSSSISEWFYHSKLSNLIINKHTFLATEDYVSLRINSANIDTGLEHLQDIQLEVGDTRTKYEPHQFQPISITLPQPLYENDIANVESGNYEYEMQKYVVTGDEVFYQDYQAQLGYYGRYFILNNIDYDDKTTSTKCYCNMLQHIPYAWSIGKEGVCQNVNKQIHLKFSNDRLGIADDTPVEEKRTAFANYLKQLYASKNPLYVVVKVAKTTQPIPPEDLEQLKKLKTFTGVTNVICNAPISFEYEQAIQIVINKILEQITTSKTNILTLEKEVINNV